MDTYKCLDCGVRTKLNPDSKEEPICSVCGGSQLVQVFGVLAEQDGPTCSLSCRPKDGEDICCG